MTEQGLRQKKREETLRRIAAEGLKLFIANGYEATTLDAIADAAGISRRTFFHYFESKEEILLAWQRGLSDAVREAILAESTKGSPLETVRSALQKLIANYNAEQAIEIDRIIRSNDQLLASNHVKFLHIEEAAYEALCVLWPQSKRQRGLRLVAMVSTGALRLALNAWSADEGAKPVSKYLKESFDALKAEL